VRCGADAGAMRRCCYRHVCLMGLEGIVSKRTDAPYRSGPSKTWLKSKNPASEAVRREREEEW
jgi:bifunctional non-homologous end joining protein LigD